MYLLQATAPRAYFSVINKIRHREKVKNPPLERVKIKPYQYQDVVGQATYEDRKLDLTPHQQYLIETKSMERPYIGNLWGEITPGFYHCAVCDTRLFSFDHKIKSESGYASFYNYVEKRVSVVEEKANIELVNILLDPFLEEEISRHKRCQCSQCQAHIGAVFFDGPYPTFLRYSINSSALRFVKLEEFPDPNIARKIKLADPRRKKTRYLR